MKFVAEDFERGRWKNAGSGGGRFAAVGAESADISGTSLNGRDFVASRFAERRERRHRKRKAPAPARRARKSSEPTAMPAMGPAPILEEERCGTTLY